MSCYNLKVVEYNGFLQFRVYKKPIEVKDDKTDYEEKKKEEQFLLQFEKDEKADTESGKDNTQNQEGSERSKKVSINRTIQSIYEYSLNNNWDWFVTLTFSPGKVKDRTDYRELVGKSRKWCDNMKQKYAPDFKYLLVPEKHKDGSYHLHALLANCGAMRFEDSGRVAVGDKAYIRTKENKDKPWIYNIAQWKLGFSSATKVQSSVRCASYITKYITKELCIGLKNYRRFYPSRNLDKTVQTTFNLPEEDIEELVRGYEIEYVKVQHIPEAGQSVKYITVRLGGVEESATADPKR